MARKKPSPNWFLCVSLIRLVTRIYAENKTGRQFCVLSFRYDKGGPKGRTWEKHLQIQIFLCKKIQKDIRSALRVGLIDTTYRYILE